MSNTKHTPGPWMVDDKAMKVRAPNGLTVAEPFTLDDARLIAAAPELLSLISRYIAMHSRASNGLCDCKVCEDSRALLAKAGAL